MQLSCALRSLPLRQMRSKAMRSSPRRFWTAPVAQRQQRTRGGEGQSEEGQLAPTPGRRGSLMPRMSPLSLGSPIFTDLEREMDSLLRSFGMPTTNMMTRGMPGMLSLAVDVKDEGDRFTIHADVPGMKKEDINIALSPDNQVMTISGERKHEERTEGEEGGVVRLERSYGSFTRSFQLPQHIDPQGIKAALNNGVLELTLPKTDKEEQQQKTINIEVGGGSD